ncbi:MAG: hypothetical protein JWN00_1742 [Actinomycetia bacterium]|nr:hypothetical protein [Actinomycetes bacterium]
MRILRYDLTAFGSFTGMSLDLSAPGVHLITGPNEAGKSTALRALAELLYGIHPQSPYDFVHAKSALRLGALLQGTDGGALEIVRTKSRNAPLVDPDGNPIDEAVLATMLGGIDRTTFNAEFALSSVELRQGGQTLVAGNGDLGQALAASRSGLSLTRTQQAIEARMAELYKRTGIKPLINVRIKALREALERKRQASLRPEHYITQEREVEAARAELDRQTRELAELRGTRSRLERLDQSLPALARRRELLTELEEINAEGVLAPEDVAERFPDLVRETRDAEQSTQRAATRIDGLDQELADLKVDEALLAQADEIEALSQDRKATQAAAQLLAHSTGTVAALRAEAAELLAQVHPGADLDDGRLYRVPEAIPLRARELHDQRAAIGAGLDQSRQALTARTRKLAEAELRLDRLPPTPDSEPLRAALTAIPQDLLARLAAAEEAKRKHHGRAEPIALELRLPSAQVPIVASQEQVTEHLDDTKQLKRDRRELTKQTKELNGRLAEQRLDLTALVKHDPPPTGDDLTHARTARDALWTTLNRPATAAEVGEYARAVEHADLIADQMFQNAERINRVRETETAIAKGEHELGGLGREQDALGRREAELAAEWTGLWAEYAGPVPKPEAATPALDRVRELREALKELGDAESTREALLAQAVQHLTRLRTLLDDPTHLVAQNVLSELPELREIAEARLSEQAAAAGDRTVAAEKIAMEQAELTEATALVTEYEEQLAAWTICWRQVLDEAGLSTERDTVGALADLERLGQVVTKQSEADRIEYESEQAAAQVERFHETLVRIVTECGRPVPPDHVERYLLVGRLHTEAKENRAVADQRGLLQRDQSKIRTDLDSARQTARQLAAELIELVTRTGVDSVEALNAAVQRRERHAEVTTKVSDLTQTIAIVSETLDDLMDQAQRTDPDQLKAELAGLAEHIGDLETQRNEQTELFVTRRTELARLDGSALAAQAAADAEIAGAALVEEAEEYLRLEVARKILLDYAEEYRNARQDPVLERAGQLFRELTREHFSGLELDHEGHSPVILARRDTSALVQAGRLSEGTADQLYLALRLASLERYADEDRGLPFTVDDIFMTFDNDRTRAALKVLNEMADRFQMIVFTHHEHLADLARAELPPERIHVHALPAFAPSVPTVPRPREERACRSCGDTIPYSGRGRPPVQCAGCLTA